MQTEEDKKALLLQRLSEVFGSERVLTDPEDLYVYSSYSRFGTYRLQQGLAVLKLDSESDKKKLREITDTFGISIKDNLSGSEKLLQPSPEPVVIVDSGKQITSELLSEQLSKLSATKMENKCKLRSAKSLPHRFLYSIKNSCGYRLEEFGDSNEGFCIMQPFFNGQETFSAKGRLVLARGLFRGELKTSGKIEEVMYSCTACGQCYDQATLSGLELNNAIVRARREIVEQGGEHKQCKLLKSNVANTGNPLGLPAEDRALWFEDLIKDYPFRKGALLYWAGCSTAYRLPEVVKSTTNILRKAGVEFGLLGEGEGCCGLILYLLGLWNEAEENASVIVHKLTNLGVRQLVTSCAGCYFAFTRVFPMMGVDMPLEVYHTSQIMESLIKAGMLELKGINKSYVWHDPCDLGRHCGVYEPPRNVIKSIPNLRFMEHPLSRSHTLCCGGGGGMWMTNRELAERIAVNKIKQLKPLEVDGVVTGCPNCILIMKYAADPYATKNVFDLSEILDDCSGKI